MKFSILTISEVGSGQFLLKEKWTREGGKEEARDRHRRHKKGKRKKVKIKV